MGLAPAVAILAVTQIYRERAIFLFPSLGKQEKKNKTSLGIIIITTINLPSEVLRLAPVTSTPPPPVVPEGSMELKGSRGGGRRGSRGGMDKDRTRTRLL